MAFDVLRRRLMLASLALLALPAAAQTGYPTRPVKIIVSLPPGSGADSTARFIAQQLAGKFRQPFVVENRPGANGFIGARAVAEAAPDGYTLFVGSNSSMVTNAALFRSLPYDPVKDFVPVERIARFAMVVVVPASSPFKTLGGLVEAIRNAPGKLNYASGSAGYQVYTELFHERFHLKGNPISYKGTAPAMTDVAAANVDYAIGEISSVLPLIRAGRIRPLAVTDSQRQKDLPQVPTVAESGAPGFDVTAWTGVFAPARVPEPIVKALSDAVRTAMQGPDSVKFISGLGGTVYPGGPQALREFQLAEIARTREIVKTAGIPVE
ncbi:tripartite tricarboxylate transporter substrate binding protein [Cupriavidus necator]|uniref:Tripartite tricarboxylate transporter substrate binding protein n=1 Tax=Cupriavidus necator TaxID=106590 RepID=A0A367P9L3_CUPNE|nr:tripartite tricarboxylate transporter substrate binding protein [Cupriavidus necator]QQX82854.1 tripartite tricarboxylate transporter substrate binding protein [Cupriavidus necator]RCJ04193.1 tripartite tricarboxylate transporter substrate binding protein [Cupriavidus necator]